uniref:Uncharacterized protein n=1 Tax=Pithovirus LCPAC103 TaxID=2506588 RepID=A0A481Z4E5_9VIRU|nr:MAG: hypothetical protein LCPAC103_00030 [Pithovirus LCPAC103]
MSRGDISHEQIMRALGIRDQCCLASMDLKCDSRYEQTLIKRPFMTSGRSPLVSIMDASAAVRPVSNGSTVITSTSRAPVNKNKVPQTMEQTIAALTAALTI